MSKKELFNFYLKYVKNFFEESQTYIKKIFIIKFIWLLRANESLHV